MNTLLPVMIAIVIVVGLTALIAGISGLGKTKKKRPRKKNRLIIINNATKKLSQDPHNTAGLIPLANLYFEEHNWEKAYSLYKTLMDISIARPEVNLGESALRYGICAVKLEKADEAIDGLSQARKIEPNSFEVNYYLGVALFIKKEYAKAIPFFKKARAFNPEAQELYEKTGLSMYHAKMYKLSLPYLKRALDVNPESKEILYSLASAMNKSGNGDRALKIFMHLRPDPRFGADSCFAAGILHSNSGQIDKAIADYQIGLKHTDAPVDIQVSIRYNLSQCYLKNGNLNDTLRFLHEIQTLRPNYKDVPMLITRYQELNQNKKLQTYLIGGKTDFIALCRQIVSIYYKKAQVKIISIEQQNEMAEIQATIETEKWEDIVVFRFSRGSGSVGELFIREFHGCLRDLRAGRGVFVTAGKFSDEAVKYIEGRPIDLIDKPQLNKLLTKLHTVSELSF